MVDDKIFSFSHAASSWLEMHLARKRTMNLMQSSAVRLSKPKLVGALQVWRRDWEVEMLAKSKLSTAQQLEKADQQQRRV